MRSTVRALIAGLSLGTTALALALPGDARAQDSELPVAVLTIQTLDSFEQADALTTALKRAVDDAPGWSTARTQKDYALQVLVLSLGCTDPPDAACEQKIADEMKVDRFIWGRMTKDGNDVKGDLHLWVKGEGSRQTTFRYSSNLTVAVDESLAGVASAKFGELVGGPALGKVVLKVGAHSGKITVDGSEAGELKDGTATLELSPGSHTLGVEIAGYAPLTTKVEVKPKQRSEVSLTPVAVPDSGPPYQQIFGFTLLGLGAVSAGVGTYGAVRVLQINSDLEEFKGAVAANKQACDPGPNGDYPNAQGPGSNEVADLCQQGDGFELMHQVAFPIAGALGVGAIILLATADWGGSSSTEAASGVDVLPSAGPLGGDVSVRVRF